MTKREQGLVILMAGAVAWGLGTLVLASVRRASGAGAEAGERAALQRFAEGQRSVVQALRLDPRERLVLDEASAPWAASPFLLEAPRKRPVEERTITFLYTGFIQSGPRQFAILNGREYQVGDVVQSSEFVVESIQPQQATLADVSGGRRITVDLQSVNAERKSP